jgi:3-oxoacyl-[acyl-carrier protein] reductase
MLLKNKNAVIYGVSDSMAGEFARVFAKEGARVFLSGRSIDKVNKVANEIIAQGGQAEAAQVDALNEKEITDHIQDVIAKAGTIDISFNGIGVQDTQNIPLIDMSLQDFVRPVNIAMQTQFLTATAAGRVMVKQRSGVILSLTATPGALGYPLVGGFGPTCCAIEGFSRDLASELGPYGVRVINIRSAGSPDSRPFHDEIANDKEAVDDFLYKLEEDTMLKQLPMMVDIANVALFLASHLASKITGVTVDVTAGTTNGLNHKTPFVPFI